MSLKQTIKEKARNNPKAFALILNIYNRTVGHNRFRINGHCTLNINSAMLKNTVINVTGENNRIIIGELSQLNSCHIYINGNNNVVDLGRENGLENATIWLEDDNNRVVVGEHNRLFAQSQLAATEGKNITIGRDCLIAPGVVVRTGDSHSLLDMDGNRINPAKDVTIGNHVWIGGNCTLLKGTNIPDDVVISTNSLVNKPLLKSFCVYGGTPVTLIKENVKWDNRRL